MLTRKKIKTNQENSENNNSIIGGYKETNDSHIDNKKDNVIILSDKESEKKDLEPSHKIVEEPVLNHEANHVNNEINNDFSQVFYDIENNMYVIKNEAESKFTNNDVIDIINSKKNNNNTISEYFFKLKGDPQNGYEYDFINTPFTTNIDVMMRIQNFIYDIIQQYDQLSLTRDDNLDSKNNLIFFYYQLIIFFYKTTLPLHDTIKAAKIGATITYRFSSIILKNIISMQEQTDNIKQYISELAVAKNTIIQKLSNGSTNNSISKTTIFNSNKSDIESKDDSEEDNEEDSEDDESTSNKRSTIYNSDQYSDMFSKPNSSEVHNYYEEESN